MLLTLDYISSRNKTALDGMEAGSPRHTKIVLNFLNMLKVFCLCKTMPLNTNCKLPVVLGLELHKDPPYLSDLATFNDHVFPELNKS